MLMANSAAIITDAFPARQRGTALGVNQVAGARRLLHRPGRWAACSSAWNWRAIFWVSVPIGAARHLVGLPQPARDGGVAGRRAHRLVGQPDLRASGLPRLLAAITYGIQPYGGHTEGWTNPWVLAGLIVGGAGPAGRCSAWSRRGCAEPMFQLGLFRIQAFSAGNAAAPAQRDRPRRAAVHADHLAAGHLAAAARLRLRRRPRCGRASTCCRSPSVSSPPARSPATCPTGSAPGSSPPAGCSSWRLSFVGLLLIPVDFSYPVFALLLLPQRHRLGPVLGAEHVGGDERACPPPSAASPPASARTFQNAGMVLSIGVFFSLLVAGLSALAAGRAEQRPRRPGRARTGGRRGRRSCRRSASCSPRSSATTRSPRC